MDDAGRLLEIPKQLLGRTAESFASMPSLGVQALHALAQTLSGGRLGLSEVGHGIAAAPSAVAQVFGLKPFDESDPKEQAIAQYLLAAPLLPGVVARRPPRWPHVRFDLEFKKPPTEIIRRPFERLAGGFEIVDPFGAELGIELANLPATPRFIQYLKQHAGANFAALHPQSPEAFALRDLLTRSSVKSYLAWIGPDVVEHAAALQKKLGQGKPVDVRPELRNIAKAISDRHHPIIVTRVTQLTSQPYQSEIPPEEETGALAPLVAAFREAGGMIAFVPPIVNVNEEIGAIVAELMQSRGVRADPWVNSIAAALVRWEDVERFVKRAPQGALARLRVPVRVTEEFSEWAKRVAPNVSPRQIQRAVMRKKDPMLRDRAVEGPVLHVRPASALHRQLLDRQGRLGAVSGGRARLAEARQNLFDPYGTPPFPHLGKLSAQLGPLIGMWQELPTLFVLEGDWPNQNLAERLKSVQALLLDRHRWWHRNPEPAIRELVRQSPATDPFGMFVVEVQSDAEQRVRPLGLKAITSAEQLMAEYQRMAKFSSVVDEKWREFLGHVRQIFPDEFSAQLLQFDVGIGLDELSKPGVPSRVFLPYYPPLQWSGRPGGKKARALSDAYLALREHLKRYRKVQRRHERLGNLRYSAAFWQELRKSAPPIVELDRFVEKAGSVAFDNEEMADMVAKLWAMSSAIPLGTDPRIPPHELLELVPIALAEASAARWLPIGDPFQQPIFSAAHLSDQQAARLYRSLYDTVHSSFVELSRFTDGMRLALWRPWGLDFRDVVIRSAINRAQALRYPRLGFATGHDAAMRWYIQRGNGYVLGPGDTLSVFKRHSDRLNREVWTTGSHVVYGASNRVWAQLEKLGDAGTVVLDDVKDYAVLGTESWGHAQETVPAFGTLYDSLLFDRLATLVRAAGHNPKAIIRRAAALSTTYRAGVFDATPRLYLTGAYVIDLTPELIEAARVASADDAELDDTALA